MSIKAKEGHVFTWDAAKGWGQIPDPLLDLYEAARDDVEKAIRNAGFNRVDDFGCDVAAYFEVFTNRNAPFQFLVCAQLDASNIEHIYLESFIDCMEFLSKYHGSLLLSSVCQKYVHEAISMWAEKTHKEYDVCHPSVTPKRPRCVADALGLGSVNDKK